MYNPIVVAECILGMDALHALYYECTQVPEQILLIAKKIARGDILVHWGPHSFSNSFELQIFAISELDDLSHWQKKMVAST